MLRIEIDPRTHRSLEAGNLCNVAVASRNVLQCRTHSPVYVGWAFAITNAPYGLLKQLDRSVLAIWVVAEDLHREAAEKVAQYGLLTKSPNAGLPLQSPYLAILNKQAQIMLKAGAELGFSPSSRTRVQVDHGIKIGANGKLHVVKKPWEAEDFFDD